MKIAVFCSANNNVVGEFADSVEELGRWIGSEGHTLVYGGANTGLMECLARSAHDAGAMVIGVVPQILEKGGRASDYIDVDIPCDNLSDRKDLMLAQSDVAIALPGGIGTLDELFTVAASHTIGYHQKRIILYNINGFWNSLIALLDDLQNRGMIRGHYSDYIAVANSFEDLKENLNPQSSNHKSQSSNLKSQITKLFLALLLCLMPAVAILASDDKDEKAMSVKEADYLLTKENISDYDCKGYVEALGVLSRAKGYKDKMPGYCSQALEHYAWMLIHNDQLEFAQQVLNEALSYTLPTDTARRYYIMSDIGHCHLRAGEYAKAKSILMKIYAYHKKKGMIAEQMRDLRNMSAYYYHVDQPSKALEYLNLSNNIARKQGNWEQLCANNNYYSSIMSNGNARRIRLLDETFELELKHNLKNLIPLTHYNLSKVYFDDQQYDLALKEANKALEGVGKISLNVDSIDIIRHLGDIYSARQNFELANYYYRETDKLLTERMQGNRSWMAEQSGIANSLMSWCHDHVIMKKNGEFELKTDDGGMSASSIVAIGSALLVVLITLFVSLRFRKQRNEKDTELALKDGRIERMENVIGYLQLFYNNQNVLLTKIYNLVKQISGRDAENNTRLRNLSQFIQNNKLDSIGDSEFTTEQQQKIDGFIARLTRLYPNLTDTEKQIASYLWLGLSTHEICVLTGNQPASINVSRYRLRKAMSLGNEEDLVNHLKGV